MQYTAALVLAAMAAPVFGQTGTAATAGSANATATVEVTRTVTAYETYCPSSTTFTEGTKTYTATKEEWVTVANCPSKCTITYNPAYPTVLPVGDAPKYGNHTVPVIPVCPCPEEEEHCPCEEEPVVPVCPCPEVEEECPCDNMPAAPGYGAPEPIPSVPGVEAPGVEAPGVAGESSGNTPAVVGGAAPSTPGAAGEPSGDHPAVVGGGAPSTPGAAGEPSGNTPGNTGSGSGNTGSSSGNEESGNGPMTVSTSSASTLIPGFAVILAGLVTFFL